MAFGQSGSLGRDLQPFEWLTDRPPEPEGGCLTLPVEERIKFGTCGLLVNVDEKKRLEEERAARRAAMEAERAVAWAWLKTPPLANCETIPADEYAKFSCAPDESGRIEAAEELQIIIATRDALFQQYEAIRTRSDRIETARASLANSDDAQRLERVIGVEAGLRAKQARRTLLVQFSDAMARDPVTEFPADALRFFRTREDVVVLRPPNDTNQTPGRLSADVEVVVLGEIPGGFSQVFHPDTGFGLIDRNSLVPTK